MRFFISNLSTIELLFKERESLAGRTMHRVLADISFVWLYNSDATLLFHQRTELISKERGDVMFPDCAFLTNPFDGRERSNVLVIRLSSLVVWRDYLSSVQFVIDERHLYFPLLFSLLSN